MVPHDPWGSPPQPAQARPRAHFCPAPGDAGELLDGEPVGDSKPPKRPPLMDFGEEAVGGVEGGVKPDFRRKRRARASAIFGFNGDGLALPLDAGDSGGSEGAFGGEVLEGLSSLTLSSLRFAFFLLSVSLMVPLSALLPFETVACCLLFEPGAS